MSFLAKAGQRMASLLRRTLLVNVPTRSYWLVAGYLCFLLFLFLFRQSALSLGVVGFWVFLGLSVAASYAFYLLHPLLPQVWRGAAVLVLYGGVTTFLLLGSRLHHANALVVMSIGVVMAAFWYGLRGAVVAGVVQSGLLFVLWNQPPVKTWGGQNADFLESLAGLWLMAMFTGVVGELYHERSRENQRLRERVERQERLGAMGEMMGGLAHELRNPLLIIKSAAGLIGEGEDTGESRELAAYIGQEVDRMNGLLTSLMDFARPEAMRFGPTDLRTVLDPCVQETRLWVEHHQRPVQVHYAGGRPLAVTGDEKFLHQAIMNLLLNAVQAIPETGQVWVQAGHDEEQGEVFVEVRDNGVGIAGADLGRIFNPFFSLREKGMGLGLSVTQRIFDAHGCRLKVESQLGQGATFRVIFPLEFLPPPDTEARYG